MKRTHVATLYRRSGTVTEDTQGRESKAWGPLATDFACNLQMLSGSVEFLAAGKDVQGSALLLVEPGELPEGVEVKPADGIVITAGRTPYSRFLVSDVAPWGARGEGWDDEAVLQQTELAIP